MASTVTSPLASPFGSPRTPPGTPPPLDISPSSPAERVVVAAVNLQARDVRPLAPPATPTRARPDFPASKKPQRRLSFSGPERSVEAVPPEAAGTPGLKRVPSSPALISTRTELIARPVVTGREVRFEDWLRQQAEPAPALAPNITETAQQTNTLATTLLSCGVALILCTGALIGRQIYEGRADPVISAVSAVIFCVGFLLGMLSEMVSDNAKSEKWGEKWGWGADDLFQNLMAAKIEAGQPIGMQNAGATCYMNAALQGIMNCQSLKRVVRNNSAMSVAILRSFIEFSISLQPKFIQRVKQWDVKVELKEGQLVHILLVLAQDEECKKLEPLLVKEADKYNAMLDILRQFQRARNEQTALPPIADAAPLVKALEDMAKNQDIYTLLTSVIPGYIRTELLGHMTLLETIELYEKLQQEQDATKAKRIFALSSDKMQKLHCFTSGVHYSQQDPTEFIGGLFRRAFQINDPALFFRHRPVKEYAIYDLTEEDKKIVRETKSGLTKGLTLEQELQRAPIGELDLFDPERSRRIGQQEQTYFLKLFPKRIEGQDALEGQAVLNRALTETEFEVTRNRSDLTRYRIDNTPVFVWPRIEYTQMIGSPECLIIKLEIYDESMTRKSDQAVKMPDALTLPDGTRYQKKTLIEHLGYTGNGGHYVAYVHKENRTWRADDSSVWPTEEPRQPYVCIYEKIPAPAAS
jgi:hypothetical protein